MQGELSHLGFPAGMFFSILQADCPFPILIGTHYITREGFFC